MLTTDIFFNLVKYFYWPFFFPLRLSLCSFSSLLSKSLAKSLESFAIMHISSAILATVLGASSLVASAPTDQSSASDLLLSLNEKATFALEKADANPNGRSGSKKCTILNAAVRRDW